jgi:glycerophosphoryl diester phosphodiesterase
VTRTPAFLASPPPRVFAHRGLAIDAPENSLLAFVRALAIGVLYLETDVRATLDGVAVLAHDPEIRVDDVTLRPIATLTARELRSIDLGHGQTVPTLAEALDGFPDARFNLDIKSADAAAPAAAAIRAARAERRVLVTSFSEKRRRSALRSLTGVASSASAPTIALAVVASWLRLAPVVRRLLHDVVAIQVPERSYGVRVVTPRMIRHAHAAGAEVHVWTVNDRDDMARLWAMGVDGIVTDRADVALDLLDPPDHEGGDRLP